MVVDDLASVGAAPLGLVDYMAVGALEPNRDKAVVASIAAACVVAGCPLLGGETAEHPGVMADDQVDLAATALGVVEHGHELGQHRVGLGNVVIGLISPNLRSNGFSLVRAAIEGHDLGERVGGEQLSDFLLAPSVIYSPDVMRAISTGLLHAAAHITGGGLATNLARVVPSSMRAELKRETWEVPEVFRIVQNWGGVSDDEMWRTFNMGIGFCLIASPEHASALIALAGHSGRVIGEIVPASSV
jgi:phosphoribosylformylglycinamidine cyclo-ligase